MGGRGRGGMKDEGKIVGEKESGRERQREGKGLG